MPAVRTATATALRTRIIPPHEIHYLRTRGNLASGMRVGATFLKDDRTLPVRVNPAAACECPDVIPPPDTDVDRGAQLRSGGDRARLEGVPDDPRQPSFRRRCRHRRSGRSPRAVPDRLGPDGLLVPRREGSWLPCRRSECPGALLEREGHELRVRAERAERQRSAQPGRTGRLHPRRRRPWAALGQPRPVAQRPRRARPVLAGSQLVDLPAGVQGPAADPVATGPAHRALLPGRAHRAGGRAPALRRVPAPGLPTLQGGLDAGPSGHTGRCRRHRPPAARRPARSRRPAHPPRPTGLVAGRHGGRARRHVLAGPRRAPARLDVRRLPGGAAPVGVPDRRRGPHSAGHRRHPARRLPARLPSHRHLSGRVHPARSPLTTLPIALRGSASTSTTTFGRLYGASWAAARSSSSCSETPDASTNAVTRSPHVGSGTPTTAASATPGWVRSTSSTSRG